MFQTVLDV